jgi:hypothetical protein
MVKIIANQTLPYGKRRYAAGEEIDATEKDAKLLVGIGKARRATVPQSAPAALTVKAPPAPEPTPEVEAAPEAPPHPQTYHRRDMVAEPPAGPTGPAKSPRSLRRGPARKAKT